MRRDERWVGWLVPSVHGQLCALLRVSPLAVLVEL